ncbi:MAG: hypothetical protein Q7T14_03845 [Aestuariivirga sp.]|nr:hypothetical protein [Aestuariivirga sp.]
MVKTVMPFPGQEAKGCVNAAYAEVPVVTSGGDANCAHAFAAISASGSHFGSALGAA